MTEIAAIAAINFLIAVSIGVSGIGGFLLPLFYVTALEYGVNEALFLSFGTFFVSGSIGAIGHARAGHIDFKSSLSTRSHRIKSPLRGFYTFPVFLGFSCFVGALLGVGIAGFISEKTIKLFLYLVVFCAGISLLLTKPREREESPLLKNRIFVFIAGAVAGLLCSLSGAGGALVLVPFLAFVGKPINSAVGIGIFASLLISLPSSIGHFLLMGERPEGGAIAAALLFHGVGVAAGVRLSDRINRDILRKSIAVFSILFPLYAVSSLLLTLSH